MSFFPRWYRFAFVSAVCLGGFSARAALPSFWHALVPKDAADRFAGDSHGFRLSREDREDMLDASTEVKLESLDPAIRQQLEAKFANVTAPSPRPVTTTPPPGDRSMGNAKVTLLLVVDPAGHVVDVFVAEATNEAFARAAALAAKSWRFEKSTAAHLLRIPFVRSQPQ